MTLLTIAFVVHIFLSEMRLVEFLMNENVNQRVELSQFKLFTVNEFLLTLFGQETDVYLKMTVIDFFFYLIHIKEIEGATNNEQSRDTGNIAHTRYRTKTNKTQKTKNISNKTWGVNSSVRER